MTQPPHILIVDDNQGIHRDFTLALNQDAPNGDMDASEALVFGTVTNPSFIRPTYILAHAMSGMEGIEKVKESLSAKTPFQLAFIDIRMPGIDGVETVEHIWALDPEIQIVFCTAYSDYSWDDLAKRLGHTDKALVLKKPFDYLEVVQMASTLTEKWRLARQAAMKLEQMELLVSKRTQKYLELQRREFERLRELDQSGQLITTKIQSSNLTPDLSPVEKEPPLILLIGGKNNIRKILADSAGSECRIIDASDGLQGFEKARELVPDMVLADINIPGINGFELCHRLKEDELACHIPVILLRDDADADAEEKAINAGADECLEVPVSGPILRTRIQHWMQHDTGDSTERILTQPRELATNHVDAEFLRRTTAIIDAQMSDFEFDVEKLAQKLFISRRQLLRKLKSVAGCSPNAFIRNLRLKRAAQLLKTSGMTVTEITYAVGFSDLKHFRTVFREQFGTSPAEYGRQTDADGSGK